MSNTIVLDEPGPTAEQAKSFATTAHCLFCRAPLRHTFVNLGMSPLCESYLTSDQLNQMEPFYPLHVKVCEQFFLVQSEQYVSAEQIFSEYAYFSSFSDSWLKHSSNYVDICARTNKGKPAGLHSDSALEFRDGDRVAVSLFPGLGRQVYRAHSDGSDFGLKESN